MSEAELKVILVGDDAEQQDAFNNPKATAADRADQGWLTPSYEPDDQAPRTDTDQPETPEPTIEPPRETEAAVDRSEQSFELIDSIENLTDVIANELTLRLEDLQEEIGLLVETEGRKRNKSDQPQRQPGEPKGSDEKPRFLDKLDMLFAKIEQTVDRTVDFLGQHNKPAGRIVRSAAKTVRERVRAFSSVGRKVAPKQAAAGAGARAAGGAAASGAGGGAAAAGGGGALGTAATVAAPVAAVAVAAIAAAYSFKKLTDAIHGLASEIDDLSPAVASVRAQAEARFELARLDRANRTGMQTAQIEAARFRIQESMYEVQTKIYEIILKATPVIELILDGINVGVRQVEVATAAINLASAKATVWDPNDDKPAEEGMADAVRGLKDAMREFLDMGRPDIGRDPWLAELLSTPAPDDGHGHGHGADHPPTEMGLH